MGAGDNLMASGMARGASIRGKRIAFGDGRKIIWDQNSEQIFRRNPNVAPPGSERTDHLEWVEYYKGHRIYNRRSDDGKRWVWNYEFRPTPGEIFFRREERQRAASVGAGFVVIEPNVPMWKSVASNKQWPVDRYDKVALKLRIAGYDVVQFVYGQGHRVESARQVKTSTFRDGLAALARASLYIGPEGGLHHGAAAVGISAVVLFGGFIPPAVTGYEMHTNLTGGAEACGTLSPCAHCRAAMQAIPVGEVLTAALSHLSGAIT
jgi:hypothetical protein